MPIYNMRGSGGSTSEVGIAREPPPRSRSLGSEDFRRTEPESEELPLVNSSEDEVVDQSNMDDDGIVAGSGKPSGFLKVVYLTGSDNGMRKATIQIQNSSSSCSVAYFVKCSSNIVDVEHGMGYVTPGSTKAVNVQFNQASIIMCAKLVVYGYPVFLVKQLEPRRITALWRAFESKLLQYEDFEYHHIYNYLFTRSLIVHIAISDVAWSKNDPDEFSSILPPIGFKQFNEIWNSGLSNDELELVSEVYQRRRASKQQQRMDRVERPVKQWFGIVIAVGIIFVLIWFWRSNSTSKK